MYRPTMSAPNKPSKGNCQACVSTLESTKSKRSLGVIHVESVFAFLLSESLSQDDKNKLSGGLCLASFLRVQSSSARGSLDS